MTEMASGDVLHLLQSGTVEIEGLLPWSSNYAFLVRVCEGSVEVGAVYKPRRGERRENHPGQAQQCGWRSGHGPPGFSYHA